MTDQPAYIRNLRKLMRSNPEFTHLEAIEKELYASGSDRATVVMYAAYVETSLEWLLASRMRSDLNSKDKDDVLSGSPFATKIVTSYAFKVIGPTTRFDLDLMRQLRNECAHSRMPFSFQAAEVRDVCDRFKLIDLSPTLNIPHGYLSRVPQSELSAAIDRSEPKTRFITTCHNVSYRMLVAMHGPREGDFAFPDDNPVP